MDLGLKFSTFAPQIRLVDKSHNTEDIVNNMRFGIIGTGGWLSHAETGNVGGGAALLGGSF